MNARRKRTEGFSLVEFMMAALILSVGILGLTMLQVLSLRSGSGSQNLITATQLGERILDQVEEEGRNTWLNLSSATQASPAQVPNLLYFAGGLPTITQYFDAKGALLPSSTNAIFRTSTSGVAVPVPSGTGALADMTVTVTFMDAVVKGQSVTRSVVLTRRVLHA